MDKEYPPEAWRRLGKVLEARRGQLGYGFRQREKFLADRGGPPPSGKTLARLERGERTFYPPATVTRLESLYGWAPGSFEAVLAGGEAKLLPAASGPAPLRPVPPPAPADPAERAAEAVLAEVLPRYEDDELVRAIAAQPGKAAVTRVLELRFARDPELDRDVLTALLGHCQGDEVAQMIGTRGGKRDSDHTGEVLDWLGSQYPYRPGAREGNGTAG